MEKLVARSFLQNFWRAFLRAIQGYTADRIASHSAALAFYVTLSLAPSLILAIAMIGWLMGTQTAELEASKVIHLYLGSDAAGVILALLASAQKQGPRTLATVFGVIALLFGASSVFVEMQDSLNAIWRVRAPEGGGMVALLRGRVIGLTMVVGAGALLFASLLVTSVITGLTNYFRSTLLIPPWVFSLGNILVSMVTASALFGMIFKILPGVRIRWREVWVGALLTGFLFTVGQSLIGLYLGRSSFTSIYGIAGSLVVVLVWVYYLAQIFFLGAKFTHEYIGIKSDF
ncbi:YihY/virulence factor BrkB family protein [Bdellovibrionota bacterium FG-2]